MSSLLKDSLPREQGENGFELNGREETRVQPIKLGIFFSHPTQHHSALFQSLGRQKGLQVKVYYFDPGLLGGMFDPGYGTTSAWDVDLMGGTESTVLRNLLRGREVSPFRQFNPGILPVILREKFDAIFVMSYVGASNWLALALGKLTGSLILYQADTNILDFKRKKPAAVKDYLRKAYLRKVDYFLAIGDKNKDFYRSMGFKDEQMVWCPIPVDHRRYEEARTDVDLAPKLSELRARYRIPEGARVVAFCGKLIERKRPRDLVAALRVLNRKDVYALLIGSGELADPLKHSLGTDDRVRITGFVNQSEIPYHMMLGDVGAVCSDFDPHPLVTTEFAMCGLPVVVSDACGVWGDHDILRPGENGFTYPCGDVDALAAGIARLLDDETLRKRMGRRSLELAGEQSAEHAADVLSTLLRRVFDRNAHIE